MWFRNLNYLYSFHSRVCELAEETEYIDSKTGASKPIPTYLYMIRHTYRTEINNRYINIKSFGLTDQVTTASNHFPGRCYDYKCFGLSIDTDRAILLHFRRTHHYAEELTKEEQQAECPVHDQVMWRFYEMLEPRVREKLELIFKTAH